MKLLIAITPVLLTSVMCFAQAGTVQTPPQAPPNAEAASAASAAVTAKTESNPDVLRERYEKLRAQRQTVIDSMRNLIEWQTYQDLTQQMADVQGKYAEATKPPPAKIQNGPSARSAGAKEAADYAKKAAEIGKKPPQ